VNTQRLETQNEPETPRRFSSLEKTEAEVSGPQPPADLQMPTEAEIQQTFQKRKAQESALGFRSGFRNILRGQRIKTPDPEPLLEMEFDAVLAILREESRQRAKRQKLFIGLFLSIVLGLVALAILTHNTSMLTFMGSYTSLFVIGAAASQQQKSAAMAITRFDDVRAAGPLAEALEFKDKDVVPLATKALISLLPRLKASDAPLLSPEQRFCLNRALRGKNTELTLAILKAWEQVGDSKAIEEVEKLAHGRGRGGRYAAVVAAAQECLPFLRQSAERQQIGSQLLRAADGSVTPAGVLLRPAMPHAPTEPSEELLRPTTDA